MQPPPPRKSAWAVFTAWLSSSFTADDYSDGSVDDEGSAQGKGTPNGGARKGKAGGVGMYGSTVTPRRSGSGSSSYTNGFSPSSGGNTSPSPMRQGTTTSPASHGTLGSSARPAFVRASTLRTIEEGDSPYGSFLSSSVPSLRHLAAISAAAGNTGSETTSPALLATSHGAGTGLVARRSVSGSSSRRGSAELGMDMIEEREGEVRLSPDEGGKRSARGKGKQRDESVDGSTAEGTISRTASRSRSRSPMTPSHLAASSSSRIRPTNAGILGGGERDDPDDPFYVSPSRTRTPTEDETTRLIGSTSTSGSPSRTPSTGESAKEQDSDAADDAEEDTATALPWHKGPLFEAGWKLTLLFLLFTIIMVGGIWIGLPRLDPEDKPALKLPRSFADLQALKYIFYRRFGAGMLTIFVGVTSGLFQKYKDRYPFRVLVVGCASYLYVQAFILPGSMYISILFGAAYGVLIGVLLSCICEATGALLNYALSAVIGPPLLTIEAYRNRLETWRVKIMGDKEKGEEVGWDGVFSFLIVLRIAPFPPHWVANIVAPHLGINPLLFWSACFIGIAPVSVIHTTIGSGLDHMTSAEDFHILSVRNVLGLLGVAVAVMIPTGLKRFFKKDLSGLSEAEAALHNPDIHIQAASLHGEDMSVSTSRNGYPDPYYASDAISYQAQDSGLVLSSPTGYGSMGDGYYYGSAKKGKGRAMDLEEALSVIENEEDHEVLAIVYEGDAEADSIIEEFASNAMHQDQDSSSADEEEDDDDDDEGKEFGYDSVASLGRESAHRGYGTIPHDVEQGDLDMPRAEDGKQWWEVWKR